MRVKTTFLAGCVAASLALASLYGQVDDAYWRMHDAVFGPPPPPSFHVPPHPTGPQKVIFHVVEKGSWRSRDGEVRRLTSVIDNHISSVEPDDIEIEVLMHGNGIDVLKRA